MKSAPTKPAAPMWRNIDEFTALFILCFVGGYVDVVGWLGLYGLFTGSVTGNLVLAGASVIHVNGVIPRVVVSGVFVGAAAIGGFLSSALSSHYNCSTRQVLQCLLVLEVASVGALWLSGQLLLPTLLSIDSLNVTFVGSMAALAMGVQSSAVKECIAGAPSTNVLTTTLTNCGALLGGALHAALALWGALPSPLSKEERWANLRAKLTNFGRASMPVVAFVSGVCLGAALQYYVDFHSCCIPVALLLFLVVQLALPLPPPAQPEESPLQAAALSARLATSAPQ